MFFSRSHSLTGKSLIHFYFTNNEIEPLAGMTGTNKGDIHSEQCKELKDNKGVKTPLCGVQTHIL